MIPRPDLLLYCQHSLGLGHLKRSWALAESLSREFRVVLASGGAPPDGLDPPRGIDVIELPPLAQEPDGRLFVVGGHDSVDRVRTARTRLLIDLYRRLRPHIVVIELFPFGRRKFHDEIVALLEETRRPVRPIVATSVRDLLVQRGNQRQHDDRARTLVDTYFDLVLVHTDPRFARLTDTFHPSRPIAAPVHHTGFVVGARGVEQPAGRRAGILVSGGGGRFAERLYATAIDAHDRLGPAAPPMTVVTGPLCPADAVARVREAASRSAGVRVETTIDDMCAAMRCAAVSVSQCGYNTALDIVRAGVPALVVPFDDNGDSEQTDRATRLEHLDAVRVFRASDAGALAAAIGGMRSFTPAPTSLDLNGGQRTAGILSAALRSRNARPGPWITRCV